MSTQKTSKAETKEDVAKASTDVVAKTSTDEAKTSKGVAKTNKDEAKTSTDEAKTSKDEDKTGEDEAKTSEGKPSEAKTRKYATRGTKGTFGGRRPPKHPALLAIFEKQKAEYLAEKEKQRLMRMHTRKRPYHTPSQLEYQAWHRTFNRSTSSSSRVAFVEAAAAWQVERAKQISQDVSLF